MQSSWAARAIEDSRIEFSESTHTKSRRRDRCPCVLELEIPTGPVLLLHDIINGGRFILRNGQTVTDTPRSLLFCLNHILPHTPWPFVHTLILILCYIIVLADLSLRLKNHWCSRRDDRIMYNIFFSTTVYLYRFTYSHYTIQRVKNDVIL